jgi:hypothetical protein
MPGGEAEHSKKARCAVLGLDMKAQKQGEFKSRFQLKHDLPLTISELFKNGIK